MTEIAKELIERSASGDVAAFEEIYKHYSSFVYTLAMNVTRNRQDAEEVTQDTFVKAFRNLKDFRFVSNFSTWLYRIAVNTAINAYNARSRRNNKVTNFEEMAEVADPASGQVKEAIENEDAASKVYSLLEILSPEQRSCIVLRELEELDYKEMAKVLKIPLNTVRTRLKRARESLAAYCRKEGICHGV